MQVFLEACLRELFWSECACCCMMGMAIVNRQRKQSALTSGNGIACSTDFNKTFGLCPRIIYGLCRLAFAEVSVLCYLCQSTMATPNSSNTHAHLLGLQAAQGKPGSFMHPQVQSFTATHFPVVGESIFSLPSVSIGERSATKVGVVFILLFQYSIFRTLLTSM